jgi:hypothetical protein
MPGDSRYLSAAPFPFPRWVARACALACMCACGAFAASASPAGLAAAVSPADSAAAASPVSPAAITDSTVSAAPAGIAVNPSVGDPPAAPRFGLDSTKAYAHAGLEAILSATVPEEEFGSRKVREDVNTALQALVQAHAFRLVGRLGVASSYPKARSVSSQGFAGGSQRRVTYNQVALSEASVRLRWGPSEADEGIQIGLMPLQGNPDAILYGNYIARYQAFPVYERRGLESWDSLGALAPKATGIRLALGRDDGPVRAEGWMVRDGGDFSWLALLSGQAPRKIKWGAGISGYQAFNLDQIFETPGNSTLTQGNSPTNPVPSQGDFIEVDSSSSPGDTSFYTSSVLLFSARVSLDLASLFGLDAPEGRYGGLFAEAALLGWQDQPTAYPDRWDRFLWTAGTRIPTFGWLDACVAQAEWRRPQENYRYSRYGYNGSWIPGGEPRPPRPSPWRESLLLAKNIGPHVTAQARISTWDTPARQVHALGRMVFRFGNR